jgi:hypothetical protein
MSGERVVQLLATRIRIVTDDPGVAAALDYLVPGAEQDVPLRARARFTIHRRDEGFVLEQEGVAGRVVVPGRAGVLAELFERIHLAALEPFRDAVRIHAASGTLADRAFLAIGAKGSGKTSLALRMLFDGCRVFGDELVLLQAGESLAFPRKFYVKPGTLRLVPEIAPLAGRLPAIPDGRGGAIRAFEPRDAGLAWRIEPVRPEVLFVLEPDFGGPSRVVELPAFRTVERLLGQAALPAHRMSESVREVCELVECCRSFLLRVGSPREAGEAVRSAVLAA